MALNGDTAVGLVTETLDPVVLKLLEVDKDQYSVELKEVTVALSGVPPEPVLNASTVATVPDTGDIACSTVGIGIGSKALKRIEIIRKSVTLALWTYAIFNESHGFRRQV